MEWWNALDINPNVDTGDTAQYQNLGMTILGVVIATAICVVIWRFLNGTGKLFVIAAILLFFVIAFVLPNWGNGG